MLSILKRKILCLTMLFSVLFIWSCEKSNLYFEDFNPKTDTYDGDLFSYLESKPGLYDSLVLILDRLPVIKDSLKSTTSEYTLFAPSNRSIEIALASLNNLRRQSNKSSLSIEDLSINELDSIVCRYIIRGEVTSDNIKILSDGKYVYGLKYGYQMHAQFRATEATGLVGFGPQEIIFSDTNWSPFHMYWTRTTTASINVRTTNGIVHMLAPGHDFSFNKFIKAFNN